MYNRMFNLMGSFTKTSGTVQGNFDGNFNVIFYGKFNGTWIGRSTGRSTRTLMGVGNMEIGGEATGGIIWEVEGRGSGSKGVAYHTDSPTQVEESSTWVGESV